MEVVKTLNLNNQPKEGEKINFTDSFTVIPESRQS